MKRVLVVGSGLAAIYFIMQLDEAIEVVWVNADGPLQTNSYLAKGGIAVSRIPGDTIAHIEDTLIASAGLADPEVVKEVIENSAYIREQLIYKGLVFDPGPGREGGHSRARIEHISDQTGKFLTEHLWKKVLERKNTILLSQWYALDLLKTGNRCEGIRMVNATDGTVWDYHASAVVLATGGCGNLFEHHTNSAGASGEGIGMAYRAGAAVKHMEFVQFHPTRMVTANDQKNILVTEAFRGAGAFLTDGKGNDFMKSLHPMGSLAPRDSVALGMYRKMEQENLPWLELDFSKVSDAFLTREFPYLYSEMMEEGYIRERKVKVTPAAHYLCGGIKTDSNSSSSLNGLYVLGESACTGLHGANRLASNSLLELFHYGQKLSETITAELPSVAPLSILVNQLDTNVPETISGIDRHIKSVMWHYFGILRNTERMSQGISILKEIVHQVNTELPKDNLWQLRYRNRLECALLIAQSAISRTQSAGCHQLTDSL